MVEILDTDGSKSTVDKIRLTDVWTVQDKPSRTRYAFEVRFLWDCGPDGSNVADNMEL